MCFTFAKYRAIVFLCNCVILNLEGKNKMKSERKSITLNLRVDLVDMLDTLAKEMHTLRPGVLEVIIGKEYKMLMHKRAIRLPIVGQVEG